MASSKTLEIEKSVTTAAPARAVIDLILDPATWPRWQNEIVSSMGPAPLKEGDVVAGRAQMLGFNVDGQSVTTAVGAGTYSQEVVVGVGMQISYRIASNPNGTVVTHSLTSELPAGALGRVLSFFLARRLKRMQRDLLEELRTQAEASVST